MSLCLAPCCAAEPLFALVNITERRALSVCLSLFRFSCCCLQDNDPLGVLCCDAESLFVLCHITERRALPSWSVPLLRVGQRPSGCAGGHAEPSGALQPHAGATQHSCAFSSILCMTICAWMHKNIAHALKPAAIWMTHPDTLQQCHNGNTLLPV
jgi:hypothetical protein